MHIYTYIHAFIYAYMNALQLTALEEDIFSSMELKTISKSGTASQVGYPNPPSTLTPTSALFPPSSVEFPPAVSAHIHTYIHTYIQIFMYIHLCINLSNLNRTRTLMDPHPSQYTCTYVHTYIHIHTYIQNMHIFIHIYT